MSDERDVSEQERLVQDAEEAPASAPTLTRDQMLAGRGMTLTRVEIPEWDGHVYVRPLTNIEQDDWEEAITNATVGRSVSLRDVKARLVALTVVDAAGVRLLTMDDVAALGDARGSAINRIFRVAQRVNFVSNADVEEMAGNSGGGRDDSSGSS